MGRLDGISRQIEHPEYLFRNYLRREAVLSSAIEGTLTTVAGLILFEASARGDCDAQDVSNYVDALNYGLAALKGRRMTKQLFNEIHQKLMEGTDIGRLLFVLYLARREILSTPMLNVNAYLEQNRLEYYDALLAISQKGAWEDWIVFFLTGVAQQANDAVGRTNVFPSCAKTIASGYRDQNGLQISASSSIGCLPYRPFRFRWHSVQRESRTPRLGRTSTRHVVLTS